MEQIILIAAILLILYFTTKISSKIPSKQGLEDEEKKLTEQWIITLEEKVPFYKNLNNSDRKLFENRTLDFLTGIIITGVKCEVEELDRILIASSAIIPVFQFPN